MVRLNKIYTRTGDAPETGLGDGARRRKDDARVAAYGEVDELNAVIGLARLHTLDGADLCVPPAEGETGALRMTPAQTEALERAIDDLNVELSPLKSFVLPGGAPAAAALHQARTVCRRAERAIVHLASQESVGASVLTYVNRLSDYLFVAARFANGRGAGDVLWIPGANREAAS